MSGKFTGFAGKNPTLACSKFTLFFIKSFNEMNAKYNKGIQSRLGGCVRTQFSEMQMTHNTNTYILQIKIAMTILEYIISTNVNTFHCLPLFHSLVFK
jgi:hypothetical protein